MTMQSVLKLAVSTDRRMQVHVQAMAADSLEVILLITSTPLGEEVRSGGD